MSEHSLQSTFFEIILPSQLLEGKTLDIVDKHLLQFFPAFKESRNLNFATWNTQVVNILKPQSEE